MAAKLKNVQLAVLPPPPERSQSPSYDVGMRVSHWGDDEMKAKLGVRPSGAVTCVAWRAVRHGELAELTSSLLLPFIRMLEYLPASKAASELLRSNVWMSGSHTSSKCGDMA